MIQFSFVLEQDIMVHKTEPMPLPVIYVCNELTNLKHYSGIDLLLNLSLKHLC